VCTVWIALLLLAAASQGPAGVAAVFFLVIAIPLVAWVLVQRARIPERLLSQFEADPKSSLRYFFDESPGSKTNVEWRTCKMMLSVLGISALLAGRLVGVTSGSGLALGVFVGLVVIVASISGLALIPVLDIRGFRLSKAKHDEIDHYNTPREGKESPRLWRLWCLSFFCDRTRR
jgi:hypothetical protein